MTSANVSENNLAESENPTDVPEARLTRGTGSTFPSQHNLASVIPFPDSRATNLPGGSHFASPLSRKVRGFKSDQAVHVRKAAGSFLSSPINSSGCALNKNEKKGLAATSAGNPKRHSEGHVPAGAGVVDTGVIIPCSSDAPAGSVQAESRQWPSARPTHFPTRTHYRRSTCRASLTHSYPLATLDPTQPHRPRRNRPTIEDEAESCTPQTVPSGHPGSPGIPTA